MPTVQPQLSFLVVSHAGTSDGEDVFGPAHNVVEHLNERRHDVEFVLHPLRGGGSSLARSFRGGELVTTRRVARRGRFGELVTNVRRLLASRADVIVLVDPLNYV